MDIIVLILYGFALILIFFYSMMQLSLVYYYRRRKIKRSRKAAEIQKDADWFPFVTVQLPIYNEMYVVERLIDAITQFDYPRDRFEIQVLDDSTDETVERAKAKVECVRLAGFDITYIYRKNRMGFKAGALENGLKTVKGEFVAIFDADFIPQPDFLKNTLPYFQNPDTGMVQTRWAHLNRNYSLLTKLQAFGLDAHFSVEQTGRNEGGYFINFNGTAGIWRKKCIEDAGGWEHDTLTEDLDLSYRAQMKGWKFIFVEEIATPAELPVVMSALKSQQFRWTKGGAQNFVKMFGRILSNRQFSALTKMHALFHLFSSSIFILTLLAALLSVPVLYIKYLNPEYTTLFSLSSLFLVCTLVLMIFYWNSYREKTKSPIRRFARFFKYFILFLSTTMGLSFHNTLAVLEGYMGKKSSFVRTPKFNIVSGKDKLTTNKYIESNISLISVIEGILSVYFLFGIISGFVMKEYGLMPFHVMLAWGFGYVCLASVFQFNKSRMFSHKNLLNRKLTRPIL